MRPSMLLSLAPALAILAVGSAYAQDMDTGPLSLSHAENQYLEAWDIREGDGPITLPPVAAKDRAAMQWLAAATRETLPNNPFPRGGRSWKEAEAVRRFVGAAAKPIEGALQALTLTHGGSYVALWRWGQLKVRKGELTQTLRHRWEERLLDPVSPPVIRDSAMRHAFCFALAEADSERFAALKEKYEDDFGTLFPLFQSAFSLLGTPAPVVHLWRLPDLTSVDLPLSELGGRHVRFQPDPGKGLPALPPDTAWVVPTRDGSQPEASTYLEGASLFEARQLIPRLEAAGRTAYLAPVRKVFETYALMYFPIQIELDDQGNITRIRMGDAALAP